MSHQAYPFRSSALAKQSVIESQPAVYPFRSTSAPEPVEPALIESPEDVKELVASVTVLIGIVCWFFVMLELMYPGWSVVTMEVCNG